MQDRCEECMYGEYDEEYDEFTCAMLWEEDVAARYMEGHYKSCPYFRPGDDYSRAVLVAKGYIAG